MVRYLAVLGTLLVLFGALHSPCASAAEAASSASATQSRAKPSAGHITTSYGYGLYGKLTYPRDFKHFNYVNPDAPKGGTVHFSGFGGTYDTFNPFTLRGGSAVNLFNLFLLYDAMMRPAGDVYSEYYCYLCESIRYPDDMSWLEFKMRKTARWHDGTPITPEDVVFSYNAMKDDAGPAFQQGLANVAKAEKVGPWTVRFTFKEAGNWRMPANIGFMSIIPKHFWQGKDFGAPIVTPPLTSGPYKITKWELGRSFTMTRVKDYWAKDLPVNKGQYNYDTIVWDYYRDSLVSLEGFKAGNLDVRLETSQKNWKTAYVFPAAKHGQVIKADLPSRQSALYQGFFFNTRRPLFSDPVLREALGYAFDFSWINKNLLYGMMVRSKSYFTVTDLASHGLPSADELKLLEPFRGEVPPRVFTTAFNPPDTDGTDAGLRNNLRTAMQMLTKAGYTQKNGKLISPITHGPVEFELLMADPTYEIVAQHWAANLKLIGVSVHLRTVDFPQYTTRTGKFDFDTIVGVIPLVPSPGTEMNSLWGSKYADIQNSFNWSGIKSRAVDALINDMIAARTRPELETAAHALDRVLLWSFYSIPHYGQGGKFNVAYWDRFGRPAKSAWFGFPFQTTWWIDPQKNAALRAARGNTN